VEHGALRKVSGRSRKQPPPRGYDPGPAPRYAPSAPARLAGANRNARPGRRWRVPGRDRVQRGLGHRADQRPAVLPGRPPRAVAGGEPRHGPVR